MFSKSMESIENVRISTPSSFERSKQAAEELLSSSAIRVESKLVPVHKKYNPEMN